ncbi:hypothetical protein GCM10023185_05620 [Hymenobacter saemangeumensis]|uniref:Peptidase S74 domain-containing protein n=1 Tax=Hymenobacter saemangeumensis TaxID=1084522 RepID=A0ABP8I144_9BACT
MGVGTTAPDASAALDVVATDKGALLPRLAEAARTSMATPAPGLIVYQTNGSQPGFWYNAGGTGVAPSPAVNWVRLTDSQGVSYDPVTGLQVGPGPVAGPTGGTVGNFSGGTSSALPFSGAVPDGRAVYLYQASSLLAAGVTAGPITMLELFVRTKSSTAPYLNFTVKLGLTTASSVSSFPSGLTTVYTGTYNTVPGWNAITLSTPFVWDGSSNLYLETCYDNSVGSAHDQTSNFTVLYNGALGFADTGNVTPGCALTSGGVVTPLPTRIPILRLTQTAAASYTLPATGGTAGQILVQQANGTAQWTDQLWLQNNTSIFRSQGNVGIGTTGPLNRLSISPNDVESKITLWDGGSTVSHYGFGVSGSQLNYHIDIPNSSHVFWAGGKNGDGAELMRIRGNGRVGIGLSNPQQQLHVYGTGPVTKIRIQNSNTGGGYGPAAVEFWSDPPGSGGEWRPGMIRSTDQATGTYTGGLAFYVNGAGYAARQDSIEVMRLTQNRVGIGTKTPSSHFEVVNDGGGNGGADDIVLRSYGPSVAPGLSLGAAHGTAAAPSNLLRDDFMGEIGFTGRANNNWLGFTSAGMYSFYKGNGLTAASELWLKTSGAAQVLLDSAGRMGLGLYPAHRLHVQGAIAANTNQGIILDAQDRPIITRGWNPFTSGNYAGLGRWGLFMEPNTLTFGVPTVANRQFQWATYNDNSTIDNRLMTLTQSGFLGLGTPTPGTRLDIVSDDLGGGGTDDVLLRSYSAAASPAIGIRRYRGTRAAPLGLQAGDVMGTFGFSGLINGNENFFRLSGMDGYYRGDGTTFLSDLRLFTSNTERIRIEADGRVGINNVLPSHQLDVNGNINGSRLYLGNTPALFYGTGSNTNAFVGTGSLASETNSGAFNLAVGYTAGAALGSGNGNTLLGGAAGQSNPGASNVTAVGRLALNGLNNAAANNNTSVGAYSGGFVSSGANNTFVGYGADLSSATQRSNATAIGYQAKVNADNALVLGGTGANAVRVGIGLTAPTHRLHIVATEAVERGVSAENTYVGNFDTRGVFGRAVNNPGYGYGGYFEGGYMGVRAEAQATSYNSASYAVSAQASGTAGSHYALYGNASGGSSSYGLWATATGATTNWAGYFQGNVQVVGTLSKSAGTFRIDHPQDPENKYLIHSFVESPDMMNVYNGNVVTDAQGNATVSLPTYFEAENKDFKYQLTVIGQFAQAIVGQEIRNNQFVVRTDKPGVKVSWQVTGVRNDKYAQQNRIVDVVEKTGPDKGKYLNPELYGRPASEGIGAAPTERKGAAVGK